MQTCASDSALFYEHLRHKLIGMCAAYVEDTFHAGTKNAAKVVRILRNTLHANFLNRILQPSLICPLKLIKMDTQFIRMNIFSSLKPWIPSEIYLISALYMHNLLEIQIPDAYFLFCSPSYLGYQRTTS